MSERVIFAQLCKNTDAAEVSTAHVEELYDTSAGAQVSLTVQEFKDLFYTSAGNFAVNCDAAQSSVIENLQGEWELTSGAFNLVDLVLGHWASDVAPLDCWTTCSLSSVRDQVLKANDLCSLKCSVCCSLKLSELVAALNQVNGASETDLVAGNLVTLSVLLKNGNASAEDVELRLNFQLS